MLSLCLQVTFFSTYLLVIIINSLNVYHIRRKGTVRKHLWIKEKQTNSNCEIRVIFMFEESYTCLLMYTFGDIYGIDLYIFSIKSNSEYGYNTIFPTPIELIPCRNFQPKIEHFSLVSLTIRIALNIMSKMEFNP